MKVQELTDIKPRIMSTWIYIFSFIALFLFALTWYLGRTIMSEMLWILQIAFPTEMNDPGVTFTNAIWTYGPFIVIIATGIYIWTQSKKRGFIR